MFPLTAGMGTPVGSGATTGGSARTPVNTEGHESLPGVDGEVAAPVPLVPLLDACRCGGVSHLEVLPDHGEQSSSERPLGCETRVRNRL